MLKLRRCLRKDAAGQLWRSLPIQGLRTVNKPAWGASAEV